MIIPVRCFTCGKVIGNKYEPFISALEGSQDVSKAAVLDSLGLNRYCCRRMVLTHVELIEQLLHYSTMARTDDAGHRRAMPPPS